MKLFKLCISIFMVLLIIFMFSLMPVFALTVSNEYNKISEDLLKIIDDNDTDYVKVYIFLKDCDKKSVYDNLEEKYNYNTKAYEDMNLYYNEVVPNISVEGKKISIILGENTNISKTLNLNNQKSSISKSTRYKINKALTDDMNLYLKRYRMEMADVIGDYVDNFKRDNNELINKVIFQTDIGEFIVAEVHRDNIKDIASLSSVSAVSLYEEIDFVPYGWQSLSLTHSDYDTGLGSELYNDGSGYDGTGVKIGIIETCNARFDEDNYNLSEANITFVNTPGVTSLPVDKEHATYVSSFVCGKRVTIDGKNYGGPAPGATVYQTCVDENSYGFSDTINAVRMLVYDYDVNVINMSFGYGYEDSEYDTLELILDDIIVNQKVTIVLAVGNKVDNPTYTLASPGNTYNSIVVGNLMTKHYSTILSPPYPINYGSYYKEKDNLPNRPDVVAPGTEIGIPGSDTTIDKYVFGNSFSAPIVTGIVAQLMQENVFALANPNAAKNFIICGADSSIVDDDSSYDGYLKERSGAGLVNAVNSFEIANSFNRSFYGAYNFNNTAPTDYETIHTFNLSAGEHLRAVLTFEKEEYIILYDDVYGNNIDIRLIGTGSNSDFCIASDTTNNNVELIDTLIESSGTYELQMRLKNSILTQTGNRDLHYWVSWRKY